MMHALIIFIVSQLISLILIVITEFAIDYFNKD